MTILATFLRWVARHALLFVVLVAALVIGAQLRQSAASSQELKASIERIDGARSDLSAEITVLKQSAVTGLGDAERASISAIDARIRAATASRTALQARRPRAVSLVTAGRDAIVASVHHDLQIELLTQEIAFLGQLRRNVEDRGKAFGYDARIAELDRLIAFDAAQISALPSSLSPARYVRCGMRLCDLADVYAERQAGNAKTRAGVVEARRRLGQFTALATPKVAGAALERYLEPLRAAATMQGQALEASLEREAARLWTWLGIGGVLWQAFGLLVLIILTPFAIRTLFYWVLAPLASLQKPIQLLDSAAPIPLPSERSGVSRSISLTPGTELLIRQGFEQTLSLGGSKATQWLLDARFPISSLVSGLYFLTRIRGAPGDTITVSAIRDPFAEIAVLTLPAGAAAVLQPRAIAGVVQPVATPMRITSHWRLGTLNAWLTWQLRFLVFHGPAEIILTGGRGVRIEPALAGRSIGQDQLIGFSAGIAYSTGRTETFIPYLFGREPLLKDRIAAGSGVLIAEEAPMAGRSGGGVRGGLEGIADAMLKVFGI